MDTFVIRSEWWRKIPSSTYAAVPLIFTLLVVIFAILMAVPLAAANERITRVVKLHHVEPQRVLDLYQKLAGKTGTVDVSSGQNAVVIHDYPESIRRFERILSLLDVPKGGALRIYVRPILHRDPQELVDLVSAVWETKTGPPPRFVSDERTGQLIVVTTAESYRKLDRLLRRLDVPERGQEKELWIEPAPPGDLPQLGTSSKKP
ncbi:MAG: hypothetical protein HUU55_21850 [Myxococcales bacterium]|nr:hypothetical protein [Myxococcales bacterium]